MQTYQHLPAPSMESGPCLLSPSFPKNKIWHLASLCVLVTLSCCILCLQVRTGKRREFQTEFRRHEKRKELYGGHKALFELLWILVWNGGEGTARHMLPARPRPCPAPEKGGGSLKVSGPEAEQLEIRGLWLSLRELPPVVFRILLILLLL